jgi:hypothetical protein
MNKLVSAFRAVFTVEHALMASLLAIVGFASLQILGEEAATSLFRISTF